MDIFILLGAPGAGKGTVAALVAPAVGARHISTGAMLREAVCRKTTAGLSAKKYMDAGELVPDSVLVEMIEDLIVASPSDTIAILDGFPRTVPQAEALDSLARKHNANVKKAVCLDVPDALIMKRLGGRRVCPACGAGFHVSALPPKKEGICDMCNAELITRTDDQPETIQNRLAVYEKQTAPLINFYTKQGKLVHVDASGNVEENVPRVLAVMK